MAYLSASRLEACACKQQDDRVEFQLEDLEE